MCGALYSASVMCLSHARPAPTYPVSDAAEALQAVQDLAHELRAEWGSKAARYRQALIAIRAGCRHFNNPGKTHHTECDHPGCVANRALGDR